MHLYISQEVSKIVQGSSIEVMVPVAVIDELLFPVLTAIERGPEVPD